MAVFIRSIIFVVFCATVTKSEAESASQCLTPRNEAGTCVPLRLCPTLIEAYSSNNESFVKYVEDSACKDGSLRVCCAKSPTKDLRDRTASQNTKKVTATDLKLLPSKQFCGMQHADDYQYNRENAGIDEFPWLVSLSASYETKSKFKFPGVLISNRYVLTTSIHKYYGSPERINATFGKYNTYEKISCVPTSLNEDDIECTDPQVKIRIVENDTSPDDAFALLRLEKTVVYTDFIRPICLPTENVIPGIGDELVLTGWGITSTVFSTLPSTKKKVFHGVIDQKECNQTAKSELLCVKRIQKNSDDIYCGGDMSAPIMYKNKTNWFIIGMLGLIETRYCGDRIPLTAEKITDKTIEWILNTIRK